MPDRTKTAVKSKDIGKILLPIARAAISEPLGKPSPIVTDELPWLYEKRATFVTLMQNQQLRGCIGTLDAYRPLLLDVKANAYAAAFRDPRFSPLSLDELPLTEIEISLLSVKEPLQFTDEQEALSQLRPGIDGVIFESGFYRSTFLPQVWEQLPEPEIFMAQLKRKAGLGADFWDNQIRLYRYSVDKWKEKDITNEVEVITADDRETMQ